CFHLFFMWPVLVFHGISCCIAHFKVQNNSELSAIRSLLHSEQNAQECDATKAQWIKEPLAQKSFAQKKNTKKKSRCTSGRLQTSNLELQTAYICAQSNSV